jgi:hypothetical protein
MFGIFQADLPIARSIWLVALTLIAMNLLCGAPLFLVGDPAALTMSLIIYTGHSIALGMLYSLLPWFAIRSADVLLLTCRLAGHDTTAILFEDFKYDRLQDAIANACVVLAAAIAAPSFGERSLNTGGLVGIGLMLVKEIVDIEAVYSEKPGPLLEVRAMGNKSVATLFLSGKPFREVRLSEDLAAVVVRLRSSGWEFDSNIGIALRRSAWLRKDMPERSMRFFADVAERDSSRADVVAEIRWAAGIVVLAVAVAGVLAGVIGGFYILYLVQHYREDSLSSVIVSWAQGIGAATLATLGMMLFLVALLLSRWLDGRSLLTGD